MQAIFGHVFSLGNDGAKGMDFIDNIFTIFILQTEFNRDGAAIGFVFTYDIDFIVNIFLNTHTTTSLEHTFDKISIHLKKQKVKHMFSGCVYLEKAEKNSLDSRWRCSIIEKNKSGNYKRIRYCEVKWMECLRCKEEMYEANFVGDHLGMLPYITNKKKSLFEAERRSNVVCMVCKNCGYIELKASDAKKVI